MKKEKEVPDTKRGMKIKKQIQNGFDIANKWKKELKDEE